MPYQPETDLARTYLRPLRRRPVPRWSLDTLASIEFPELVLVGEPETTIQIDVEPARVLIYQEFVR